MSYSSKINETFSKFFILIIYNIFYFYIIYRIKQDLLLVNICNILF